MEDNFNKTKFSPADISNSPQDWDNGGHFGHQKTREWDIHRSGNVDREINFQVANPKSKTNQVTRQKIRKSENKLRNNIRKDIFDLESYYDDYFEDILRQL